MKKITRSIIMFVLVAVLFIAAPAGLALPRIFAATEDDKSPYLPAGQNRTPFTRQQVTVTDVSTWTSTVSPSVNGTAATISTADFAGTVSNQSLTKNPYMKYSPTWAAGNGERDGVVMLAQRRPHAVKVSYTKDAIELPANGYYILSVDYYVLGSAETGFFTLVNSAVPDDKSKTIKLSKQSIVTDSAGTLKTENEYTYAYTEWTHTYLEYTYEEDTTTPDPDNDKYDNIKYDAADMPAELTGYKLKGTTGVKKSITTRVKDDFTITFTDGTTKHISFTTAQEATEQGVTVGTADGVAKTMVKDNDNKLPNMVRVGDKDDGYTLTKITNLTTLKSYWETAYFFVKTDMLAAATVSVTVGANLGGANEYNGAAYFDNFQCWAVTPTIFDAEYEKQDFKWQEKIDWTNTQIEREHDGGEYPQFVWYDGNGGANTLNYSDYFQVAQGLTGSYIADLNITNTSVPSVLRFASNDPKANYFHTENGNDHSVMLVAANAANSGIITKEEHNFYPKPHEVYMIQFYVTGAATTYYFRIGDEYKSITGLSYPYHNGWQLNTFFITGDAIDSVPEDGMVLGFYIGDPNSSALGVGWMAIDGFQITRVSGAYAAANTGTGSVQLNTRDDSAVSPANAYFDKGTAADIYIDGRLNTQYPYPLTATGWTPAAAADTQNGIMNTQHTPFGDVPNPQQIIGRPLDNNVYMMRNFNATVNTVSAPSFTTTANATTYISFDAQVRAIAQAQGKKKANIIVRYSDPVSTKTIELGRIPVWEGTEWKRYELGITEGEFAVARTVELVFEITDSNAALFFDNIKVSTTDDEDIGEQKFTVNPLTTVGAWSSSDNTTFYDGTKYAPDHADGGVLLMNEGDKFTTLTNAFAFSAADASYYKFIVTVNGTTDYAHLHVDGYEGRLSIMRAAANADDASLTDYTIYLYNPTAMELSFKIDLGKIDDPDDSDDENLVSARIYITKLQLTKLADSVEYDEWKAKWDDENNTDTSFAFLTVQSTQEEPTDPTPPSDGGDSDENNFFGSNWWYLIPTLITAIAIVAALSGFLFRRLKFNRHITRKGTSYARDVRIEEARKNIKAVKSVKQEVDKTDKTIDNNTVNDKGKTK